MSIQISADALGSCNKLLLCIMAANRLIDSVLHHTPLRNVPQAPIASILQTLHVCGPCNRSGERVIALVVFLSISLVQCLLTDVWRILSSADFSRARRSVRGCTHIFMLTTEREKRRIKWIDISSG